MGRELVFLLFSVVRFQSYVRKINKQAFPCVCEGDVGRVLYWTSTQALRNQSWVQILGCLFMSCVSLSNCVSVFPSVTCR